MSDRYPAQIEFPAAALDEELKSLLEEEGVEFDPLRGDPDLSVGIKAGIFHLHTPEADWGQFEKLETMLKGRGVPFDRDSAPYFDCAAKRVIFRPAANGKPAQELTFLLLDDEPAVSVQKVGDLLTQGVEVLQAYLHEQFPSYLPLSDYVKVDMKAKRHADRAMQAMRGYAGYKEIVGDFPDATAHIDCVVDLVTDLLHLAKIKWSADEKYILRMAGRHFEAEQDEEG